MVQVTSLLNIFKANCLRTPAAHTRNNIFTPPSSVFFSFYRAFVRILCVCCPRKIRRKYQPTMRSKASQVRTSGEPRQLPIRNTMQIKDRLQSLSSKHPSVSHTYYRTRALLVHFFIPSYDSIRHPTGGKFLPPTGTFNSHFCALCCTVLTAIVCGTVWSYVEMSPQAHESIYVHTVERAKLVFLLKNLSSMPPL